jgi:excinuclease ABC subunit C
MTLIKNPGELQLILKSLPNSPGVYQFFDEEENIIYIGKAISLKKRVASYFNRDAHHSGKISVMLKKIVQIRHIVVDSEIDALLLENNLIKKYQPRYNILLKDDKTFPWICIKKEPFPRIFPTRNVIKDGSQYFGPYASGKMMHTLLDLVRRLFQYRTCSLNLTRENIEAGKYKVCLEYHLGNCLGPCEGKQTKEDYCLTIDQITQILKGNLNSVMQQLRVLMNSLSSQYAFEKAQLVKEKLDILEKYQAKSMVVNPAVSNVDVFSIVSDEESGYVNFLKVVDGAIVQAHTIEMKKKLDETEEELLELGITEIRQRFESGVTEIIVPINPAITIPGIRYVIPQKGDKKKLLELSERNAKYYRLEKLRQKELVDPRRHTIRLLEKIQKDLGLPKAPEHIECFDNSNTQGSYPVAAMVVFRDAKPFKKDYRHFNIKTVEGPDDFASMEEVVYRRYKRLLEEQQPLPQLVVVDGGKGQLSSAVAALEKLGIREQLPVIGIAKRLEEIYFPGDSIPVYIDKKSETLKVIQHMRDEAHRFGITHHRQRRQKGSLKSELADIKGIGEKTATALLRKFKSVQGIKDASLDQIAEEVGAARAKILKDYFSAGV